MHRGRSRRTRCQTRCAARETAARTGTASGQEPAHESRSVAEHRSRLARPRGRGRRSGAHSPHAPLLGEVCRTSCQIRPRPMVRGGIRRKHRHRTGAEDIPRFRRRGDSRTCHTHGAARRRRSVRAVAYAAGRKRTGVVQIQRPSPARAMALPEFRQHIGHCGRRRHQPVSGVGSDHRQP